MLNKKLLAAGLLMTMSFGLSAQEKRPLTHDDYDAWESVSSEKVSKNGKWVAYEISPQDGDGRIEVAAHQNPAEKHAIQRGKNFVFSNNGDFLMGLIKPQKDSLRVLKLKNTAKDKMPKDSLFILSLGNGEVEKMAKIKSFKTPKDNGNWLAVHFEKETKKQDKSDTTEVKDKPKKTEGTNLLVRSFDGEKKWTLDRVKDYGFSDEGNYLYFTKATEDTLKNEGAYILNLRNGETTQVDEGKVNYAGMVIDGPEKNFAFMATEDSLKAKKPYYDLYLYDIAKKDLKKVAGKGTQGILEDGMVSKNGDLVFSKDGSRLYFGTAPDYVTYEYEEDTTILKEERVSLDIWGWQDDEIQPMQLKQKDRKNKKTYLATYHMKSGKVTQVADMKVENINRDKYERHKLALGSDDKPYRRNYSWDIQIGRDVYVVDLETGEKTLVEKNLKGYPSLSPEAKFVYWYSTPDSTWMAYDIKTKQKRNLLAEIDDINFYDEIHDSPSMPSSYGNGGWLKNDEAFLVYDKYDIWKVDPTGKKEPVNITKGEGRQNKVKYRIQTLHEDEEEYGIDSKSPLVLTAFHEFSKKNGFYKGDLQGKNSPEELLFTDHRYYGLKKAEKSDEVIVRRSTYHEYPDLYATSLDFANLNQISETNSQQADVNWGSVELVDYRANDGTPMQGLLFKPENFREDGNYPMMVYFYERNSDGLHNYRPPAPSASTINIPFFVSNDYVVFVPDIKYDLGLPGPSAFNSIMPGVQKVADMGFVDKENMAIQGQSWGGYQVAYLITQTDMFKAAGAGAPVVNMTSAYGGIRWGTGMSRMFQYEQTQSRIGGTLWEKPLYYIENSPLFYSDRVNTPVLIMHNDADGAVPWYQGIEMFMALKRLNSPAWLLVYNDEDHNLVQRKNRKDLSIRLSQFFDHYLKDAPAPLWMTEGLPATEKGRTLKYELSE
ncbi:S9 family peptidase [Litoribacter ruber]|uniref:S9 family peptidase n=1 Tax=Litoribacter ruber TaxID=702568 RepID=UPI001BD97883|nr:prolyl oligopeptidase family serine peptidase [Litoribacter ruber]MBT0811660.1 S9 family peptidase [Litoribacter ruber]